MRAPRALAILLIALTITAFTVAAAAMWWAVKAGGAAAAYMSIAFVTVAAGVAAHWKRQALPANRDAHRQTDHACADPDRSGARPCSGPLAGRAAVGGCKHVCTLRAARGEVDKAVSAATRHAEEQKSRLEAILLDLSEGVIVCNLVGVFAGGYVGFTLSAAAGRMGVEVVSGHTLLGDAMTTAAIFVKLLDLLEARAIKTFGQAARISRWMIEQRRQEAQLR